MKLNGIEMVHHHVCYEKIHGYDFVILMPKGEHFKLHYKLRKNNKCNISVNDLWRISMNSNHIKKLKYEYNKNNYDKFDFIKTMIPHVQLHEIIRYNYKTGNISYWAGFRANSGKKLWYHNVL